MQYTPTDKLQARISGLEKPMGDGIIQALRNWRAGKLQGQLGEIEEGNKKVLSNEMQMLINAMQGAQAPMKPGMTPNFQHPETQSLALAHALKGGTSEMPSNVQEWQYFSKLPPEQQEQYLTMRRGTSPINLGDRFVMPSQVNPAGSPQAEFQAGLRPGEQPAVQGAQAAAVEQARTDAIPGRVAAETSAARTANQAQAATVQQRKNEKLEFLEGEIDKAIGMTSGWTTGWGSLLQDIPGTPARDLKATVDTIRANVGFEQLQAMRDASPTGGALGQVSEQENRLLQSLLGNLELSQSTEQFLENLELVRHQLREIVHGGQQQYDRMYSGQQQGAPSGGPPVQVMRFDENGNPL